MLGQIVIDTTVGLGIAATLVGTMATVVGLLYKQLRSDNETMRKELKDQLAAKTTECDNYKQLGFEAVGNLRLAANKERLREGKAPYEDLAPVVGEHNSPMTEEQRIAAELQTLRAASVAAALDLGLPPRGSDVVTKSAELMVMAQEVHEQLEEEKDTELKSIVPPKVE